MKLINYKSYTYALTNSALLNDIEYLYKVLDNLCLTDIQYRPDSIFLWVYETPS